MKAKSKKVNLKNWYFFAGPLALITFILLDVVGGTNYPGYDWFSQPIGDLKSINSYDFVLSIVLCSIYVILTVFTV